MKREKRFVQFFWIIVAVSCVLVSYASYSFAESVFDGIYEIAEQKEGVKIISYEQFVQLRDSGEGFVLVDVLSKESYDKGHIPGALSFPVSEITEETAKDTLPQEENLVVYCGGFKCGASIKAAQKLAELGYEVVDFKGGLEKWEEMNNKLET